MSAPGTAPAMLIALPQGLGVSGVTLWAVRLVNALAARGRVAGLIVHAEPPGFTPLDLPIDAGVRIFRVPASAPAIDACRGDLSGVLPHYRAAVKAIAEAARAPVVLSPNLHGDCYGVGAALTRDPDLGARIRLVGWQHSDIEYDSRVLARFEPVIAGFVAVSERIGRRLGATLGARAADMRHIPYGVEVPDAPPTRPPGAGRERPLRLIYTGRLEHRQKRILALPALSRVLAQRGVAHELTIVGDGPAEAELLDAMRDAPGVRRLAPVSPDRVARLLDEHDAFVLASRYEGLSVSMLEAMARGCVPIVARTESGALEAIDAGVSGMIADASPEDDEPRVARALADAVGTFLAGEARAPGRLGAAAWHAARERYSIGRHADRVASFLRAIGDAPARAWPADRPPAFSAAPETGASGSVPPDGARRMAELLRRLAGRRVIIHGTGQHTLQLERVIRDSPALIVAFADDDRARHGTRLWGVPVIAPRDAAATGATDAVISSWMHQDAVWARREVYERAGVVPHRVY